jgi:anti-sigma regulatory factor (Ser/Thr protein kinase)
MHLPSLMHLVIAPGTADLTATLSGTPAAVAIARRLTREALTGCPRADDLVLAVSELASNAVIHSASGQGGTFALRVRTAPRWARVEITDLGPYASPAAARHGWGLAIVADITDRTGATITSDGSRVAWAEATWPTALQPVGPSLGPATAP